MLQAAWTVLELHDDYVGMPALISDSDSDVEPQHLSTETPALATMDQSHDMFSIAATASSHIPLTFTNDLNDDYLLFPDNGASRIHKDSIQQHTVFDDSISTISDSAIQYLFQSPCALQNIVEEDLHKLPSPSLRSISQ